MLRSLVQLSDDGTGTIQRNMSTDDLQAALASGAMAWIDITDPVEDDLPWLEAFMHLHPAVVKDLARDDRRPTLLIYPEYVFLSLFQPKLRLKKVEAHEIHCLIGENFLVTVRRSETKAVDEAYDRVAKDTTSWQRGMSYFLYLTMQFVVDSYYPLLDKINLTLNDLESAALAGGAVSQYAVYHIKHQLMAMRGMLAPQREVLSDVLGQERVLRSIDNRDLFRHLYERLLRVYDLLDAQRDFTSNVLDLIQNQEAARLANAVNRLTILSMLILPLTLLIGLFELNFITTDPGLVIPISGAYLLLILLAALLLTGVALSWFFRRRGWL